MSGQVSTPEVEIARLAAQQHGCVTRSQLLNAGFDGNAIDYRVRCGRLILRHRGVYAVGHVPPSPYARAMAAVLACGPEAVLSHRSAAALFGLRRWPQTLEVTAPTDHRVPGVRTHRSRNLTDVTRHYDIPVTTPARTLHDLARVLDPTALTRATNEARLRHLVRAHDVGAASGPTRSVFEDAFLAFVDGRTYHDDFERDRERDADLLAAGLRVVRVTWRRLTAAEHREAARFAALLA